MNKDKGVDSKEDYGKEGRKDREGYLALYVNCVICMWRDSIS